MVSCGNLKHKYLWFSPLNMLPYVCLHTNISCKAQVISWFKMENKSMKNKREHVNVRLPRSA